MPRSYTQHYEEARRNYLRDHRLSQEDPSHRTIADLGVRVLRGDDLEHWSLIRPHDFWHSAVQLVAQHVREKFSDEKHCFFPKDWKRETDLSLRLLTKVSLRMPGAEALCEAILPQVERIFFQCALQADHIYFYRNLVTQADTKSSWLWHYDNHPNEMHKMMIYLTDVTEETAPFEYLSNEDGLPVLVPSSRTGPDRWTEPKWKGSRVPQKAIENYQARGFNPRKVTGPRGTVILFDDNCIHRANVGRTNHRDVMVVQFRPTLKALRPYLDPAWTGSFEANDINRDPDDTRPYKKDN